MKFSALAALALPAVALGSTRGPFKVTTTASPAKIALKNALFRGANATNSSEYEYFGEYEYDSYFVCPEATPCVNGLQYPLEDTCGYWSEYLFGAIQCSLDFCPVTCESEEQFYSGLLDTYESLLVEYLGLQCDFVPSSESVCDLLGNSTITPPPTSSTGEYEYSEYEGFCAAGYEGYVDCFFPVYDNVSVVDCDFFVNTAFALSITCLEQYCNSTCEDAFTSAYLPSFPFLDEEYGCNFGSFTVEEFCAFDNPTEPTVTPTPPIPTTAPTTGVVPTVGPTAKPPTTTTGGSSGGDGVFEGNLVLILVAALAGFVVVLSIVVICLLCKYKGLAQATGNTGEVPEEETKVGPLYEGAAKHYL